MLNSILYRSKLVPMDIGLGFSWSYMYLASGFLPLFGHSTTSTIYTLIEVPLALQEMVLRSG